jgi:hypothetical protein
MSSRTHHTPVGQVSVRAANPATRRGTPWQERSPFALWPTAAAVTAAFSPGHHPAHPRLAISTREHQTGGAPTRSASTRRGHLIRAPPTKPPTTATRRPERLIIRCRVPTSRTPPASLRDRLHRSLTRPPHPRSWHRSRQGADRPALNTVQPRPENRADHHNAVLTLDRAVPHQGDGGGPAAGRFVAPQSTGRHELQHGVQVGLGRLRGGRPDASKRVTPEAAP